MTDREYLKLNSSLQTASNSDHLLEDGHGNVLAKIEMRLPDNIFTNDDPDKRTVKVEMETTKLRLSMENVPIAQLPMDMDLALTNPTLDPSTCQLDVFPLCLADNATLEPTVEPSDLSNLSFPKYKSHSVTFNIKFTLSSQYVNWLDLFSITVLANTVGYGFPEGSKYYPVLQKAGLLSSINHLMNLCVQSNHEPISYPDGQLLLKNVSTIEQTLQDALENAVTFASTSDEQVINVYLVNKSAVTDETTPKPDLDNTIFVDEYNLEACFWYSESLTTTITSDLNFGFKPIVSLSEQSLTIEYDTAPFASVVPIIWNPAYVDTYSHPEQLLLDDLRKAVWMKPPLKRAYRYNMKVEEDLTYQFALAPNITCAVMNIIANKTMKETFSFLPWCKIDTDSLAVYRGITEQKYHVVDTKTTENTVHRINKTCTITSTEAERQLYLVSNTFTTAPDDQPALGRIRYTFKSPTEILAGEEILNTTLRATFTDQDVSIYGSPTQSSSRPTTITYTPYDTPEELPLYPDRVTIVQDYETNTTMTPGTSTINDQTNTSYGEAETHVEVESAVDLVLYSLSATPGGSVSYKAYGLPDVGTWAHSITWWYKMIPNCPPATFTLVEEGEGFYSYQAEWYTPNPAVIGVIDAYLHQSEPPYQIKSTSREQTTYHNTIVREVTVNEDAPESVSPQLIPNFSNQTTLEPFYILDGTTAMVSISEPLPIMDNVIPGVTGSGSDESEQIAQGMKRAITTTTTESKQVPSRFRYEHSYGAEDYFRYAGVVYAYVRCKVLSGEVYDEYHEAWTWPTQTGLLEVNDMWYNINSLGNGPELPSYSYDIGPLADSWTNDTATINADPITETVYSRDSLPVGETSFKQEGTKTETVSGFAGTETFPTRTVYSSELAQTPPVNHFPPPFVYIYRDQGNPDEHVRQPTCIFRGYQINWESNEPVYYSDEIFGGCDNISTDDGNYLNVVGFLPCKKCVSNDTISQIKSGPVALVSVVQDSYYRENDQGYAILEVEIHNAQVYNDLSGWEYIDWGGWGRWRTSFVRNGYPTTLTSDPSSLPADLKANYGTYIVDDAVTTEQRSTQIQYVTETTRTVRALTSGGGVDGSGLSNVHVKFVWDGLPIIVMSPLASIVLVLDGMRVSQEIQPVNAVVTASNLTQTVAIIENYFPVITSLRDLHDELIIARSEFDVNPRYLLDVLAGQARDIKLSAKYITKDGKLHDLYVPINGTFSLQLTFRVTYFTF